MGNNACCSADGADTKNLESAIRSIRTGSRLDQDIRLAQQNRLKNSQGSSVQTMFGQSPPAETSHRRPKNKNQRKGKTSITKKQQPKSILKPSSFQRSPSVQSFKDPKRSSQSMHMDMEATMQQLTLRLRKLDDDQQEAAESTDEFERLQPSSGAVTQNSTPTTIDERVNGPNHRHAEPVRCIDVEDLTPVNNECRLEDLFNSDEDDSDEGCDFDDQFRNFTEVSGRLKQRHRQTGGSFQTKIATGSRYEHPLKAQHRRSNNVSGKDQQKSQHRRANFDLEPVAHRRTNSLINDYSSTTPGSSSKLLTPSGLYESIVSTSTGKISALLNTDTRSMKQEFDASLLGESCHQSTVEMKKRMLSEVYSQGLRKQH